MKSVFTLMVTDLFSYIYHFHCILPLFLWRAPSSQQCLTLSFRLFLLRSWITKKPWSQTVTLPDSVRRSFILGKGVLIPPHILASGLFCNPNFKKGTSRVSTQRSHRVCIFIPNSTPGSAPTLLPFGILSWY